MLTYLWKTFTYATCSCIERLWDRRRRPEGGVNGSRSKFLLKFKPLAYIPKPPQTLEPRSARIAMNKLSRSKRPESQSGSKTRKLLKLWLCWVRPVWPLARTGQTGRAGIWKYRPVRPVSQTGQTGCSQTAREQKLQIANLEQTKSKSHQTWRKAS